MVGVVEGGEGGEEWVREERKKNVQLAAHCSSVVFCHSTGIFWVVSLFSAHLFCQPISLQPAPFCWKEKIGRHLTLLACMLVAWYALPSLV